MMGWLVAFGLGFSPADRDQEEAVRILYVHVPTVWLAYLAFIVTAVCSALYLFTKKHSLGFDRFAGASAEIGVVFMALTLVDRDAVGPHHLGRLLGVGRPAHHDGVPVRHLHRLSGRARPRRQPPAAGQAQRGDRPARRARDPARALVSVHLWRSLHQEATVLDTDGDVKIDGLMLFSLFVGVVAFTLLYVWLVLHRSGRWRCRTRSTTSASTGRSPSDGRRRAHERLDRDGGRRLHLGSYVVTFAVIGGVRLAGDPRRADGWPIELADDDKYWT